MSKNILNDINVNRLDELLDINDKFRKSVNNSIPISSRKLIKELTLKSINYGEFVVIGKFRSNKNNRRRYIIKFKDTDYVTDAPIGMIREGSVKDYMKPFVYGVGYLGLKYKVIKNADILLHKNMYNRWVNMIRRCYDPKDNRYYIYGLNNVSVSKRWHNYSNYYYDTQKLPNYDRSKILSGKLSLDKDKFQQGIKNKVYSKDTCCWLTSKEQNIYVDHDKVKEPRRLYFICIHPDGHKTIEKGIGKFARNHNLDRGDCSKAVNGKKKAVKGYIFRTITDDELTKYKQTLKVIE